MPKALIVETLFFKKPFFLIVGGEVGALLPQWQCLLLEGERLLRVWWVGGWACLCIFFEIVMELLKG